MKRLLLILLLLCLALMGYSIVLRIGRPAEEKGRLEVHFLNVGQADAALLTCEGQTMLIDGGNAEDSDLVYTYLMEQGIKHLDYMVSTHPHEDHVGGLAGALNACTVGGGILTGGRGQ